MSSLLYRQIAGSYPVAARGEGAFITDRDGRRFIDACGGAAVSSVGHGHPKVLAAMREQLDRVDYVHTSFFTTEATEALADELVAHAPPGMTRVILLSGGSEAMESALKLARQTALERGQAGRTKVISRRQSYHGNTLGALSISGNVGRRKVYAPLLFEAHFIDPCFSYRQRRDGESEEDYGIRAASELEAKILELGPKTVLAFTAETVVGATAGAVPPAPGYLRKVREICDRHGVLLILDEVMCGMGRTGTLHACEQEGVAPDIMAVAKGLGGGYAPIGAVFASKAIHQALAAGSGTLQNGFTYMGHPFACAAALAVQRVIQEEDLLANVRRQGEILHCALEDRLGQHANVGDIRGRGMFLAIEFVEDRETKRPFDPGRKLHELVRQAAMEEGLLVYAMGGTIDGTQGNHVMLAPPYTIDDDLSGEIAARLAVAVQRVLSA
jgi:adenosylmethionine-8-amino-7-oxononanoate aminotransferase